MTNILLGEISSSKAIVTARHLKKTYKNINIVTYDNIKATGFFHTKYSDTHYVLEFNSLNQYLENLAALVAKCSIDVFIPIHSDYIGDIIQNKEMFGHSLSYVGNFEDYTKLHNKSHLQSIARKLEIDTPIEYSSFVDAKLPFVCKPVDKSSAKGIIYVKNETERIAVKNELQNNYICQEYIEGTGCGYSIYALDGVIKVGYGHIRLAEYPVTGGSSIYRDEYYHPDMETIVKLILSQIKWTGFAMFEFKVMRNNRLVLIEVNPRIWGSINQGLQNGVNYFEPVINEEPSKKTFIYNYKTYLSPQIILSFIGYFKKGNLKPLFQFLKNLRYNKKDVGLITDTLGWISVIIRFLKKYNE